MQLYSFDGFRRHSDYNRVPLSQLLYLTSENISRSPAGTNTIAVVLSLFALLLAVSVYRDREAKARQDLKFRTGSESEQVERVRPVASSFWNMFKTGLQLYHTWSPVLRRKSGKGGEWGGS